MSKPNIILFNKPMNVHCQFKKEAPEHVTLADFIKTPEFYAAGRLDKDSEGLLVLTNDGKIQARISHPKFKMAKTYWVQVEGEPSKEAIQSLCKGVNLKDGKTRPADVELMEEPESLWERTPPIRYRKNISTSWLKMTIREGKNRQVRRMTAAVGLPTLRLIRYSIGPWSIDDLKSGQNKMITVKMSDLV